MPSIILEKTMQFFVRILFLILFYLFFSITAFAQTKIIPANNLQNWQLRGGIGIFTPKKSYSGSYIWRQQGNYFNMHFIGPLAAGAIRLYGTPRNVTLIDDRGQRFSANSAERLLANRLGWHIPVSTLYYWIRGIPAPGSKTSFKKNNLGQLIWLRQQGWTIQYGRYSQYGRYYLPRKIFLTYQKLRVRVAVNIWQIN